MGDVTYLLPQQPFSPVPVPPPAALALRRQKKKKHRWLRCSSDLSISDAISRASQEFIHAAIAVAAAVAVDPPASCLSVARQTDRGWR